MICHLCNYFVFILCCFFKIILILRISQELTSVLETAIACFDSKLLLHSTYGALLMHSLRGKDYLYNSLDEHDLSQHALDCLSCF